MLLYYAFSALKSCYKVRFSSRFSRVGNVKFSMHECNSGTVVEMNVLSVLRCKAQRK